MRNNERPIILPREAIVPVLSGTQTEIRQVFPNRRGDFRLLRDDPMFGLRKGDPPDVGVEFTEGEEWPRLRFGRVVTRQQIRFRPGLHLWVRESWARTAVAPIVATIDDPIPVYRDGDNRTDYGGPWCPPVSMPRWAARIILEVTAVRAERLYTVEQWRAKGGGDNPVVIIVDFKRIQP